MRLSRWERWWRLAEWPRLQSWCGAFDVYHGLHHLMPPTGEAPGVLTVHDLRRHRLPELYPHSNLRPLERAVAVAERVLAVSEATRKDVIELLGVAPSRVDVACEAVGPEFRPASPEQARQTKQWLGRRAGVRIGRMAVTLSSRDRRKNISTVVRAFLRAADGLQADYRLVIVGHLPEDEELARQLASAAGRVLAVGPLADAEYRRVLAAAEMLLFLSLYEGFGLPILEAMASGTVVLGSDVSSIPEVIGEAGVTVNPRDEQAIAEAIGRLAEDGRARERLRAAGLHRRGAFTWDRAAAETMECYRRAVASRSR